jgi:hypothetical protein
MARTLSEDHKAAMQAGRVRAAAEKAGDTEKRKAAYSVWSKANAKAWMLWQDNCGRLSVKTPDGWVRCTCEYCLTYRASNAAMPDMRGIEGEKE